MSPELARTHDGNRLTQIPAPTGMKIGCGQGNVPERRYLEHILIRRRLSHLEPTLVARRQQIRTGLLDDTEGRVHAVSDIDAVVTRRASLIHECLQSSLLLCRERRGVPSQVSIE